MKNPSNNRPYSITLEVSCERLLRANSAHLSVVLEGQSLISKRTTFRKAEEVQGLIEALIADGLSDEQVEVVDVQLETDHLAKIHSSKCLYMVEIKRVPIETLSSALATVAGLKQAKLRSLQWHFGDLVAEQNSLREEAMQMLMAKANRTAEGLGVRLLGIFTLEEELSQPWTGQTPLDSAPRKKTKRRGKMMAELPGDLGISLGHSSELSVLLKAEFHVSGFEVANS